MVLRQSFRCSLVNNMSTQISATTNPVLNANRFARDVNGITAILHITTLLDDISVQAHRQIHGAYTITGTQMQSYANQF